MVLPSWSLTRPADPRDLRGYQFDYPERVNVTLRGLPVHSHPDLRIREWVERAKGQRCPVLHREYLTPEGTLNVAVNQTADWPYGDRMLFVDDFTTISELPRAPTGSSPRSGTCCWSTNGIYTKLHSGDPRRTGETAGNAFDIG